MGRRGMVTIGVAVQAETFSSSNNPSPVPNLDPGSAFSSKSAIFLPPSKDGSPQTLRITFNYNKDTNLPEIVVNLDGKENEDKYLELKELCRGNVTALEGPPESHTKEPASFNNGPKDGQGNDVQVYYFNEIKMDSEKKVDGNEANIPATTGTDPGTGSENRSQAENKQEDIGEDEKANCKNHSESASKPEPSPKNTDALDSREISNGKVKKQKKSNGNGQKVTPESRGTSMSPDRRSGSPTKDFIDKSKIPIIHSSATGFMPCEYYRQKLLQDMGCTDFTNPHWTPNYYNSIHKTAGQKVINKLAAQQKHLEELAAAHRRRTEFIYHEDLGFCEVPDKFPLKKKQTRLEPLRIPRCY